MLEGERYTKRCERWNTPGQAHALTFSCYCNRPFLSKQRTCEWLVQAIDAARRRHAFDLWAYVFMPDHVHLVIYPRCEDYSISRILLSIRQPVSEGPSPPGIARDGDRPAGSAVSFLAKGRRVRPEHHAGGHADLDGAIHPRQSRAPGSGRDARRMAVLQCGGLGRDGQRSVDDRLGPASIGASSGGRPSPSACGG